MSEAERLRRQEYKRNRKKWILIQTIALAVLFALALGSFAIYDRMNRTYYIEYTERGAIDYRVHLKDNDFFEEDFVDGGRSYVSSLVDGISAEFDYALDMAEEKVGFDYTYRIDAQLIIANKDTGDHIYAPTYDMVPKTTENSSDKLSITKGVDIDYNKYNDQAKSFIDTYGLKNATSTLVVTMYVDVLSNCDKFEGDNENSYFISLNIPLAEENFSIHTTSSTADNESKVLACSGAAGQKAFLVIGIIAVVLAALAAIALVVFIYITRNEDVNYTNKVKKLLSSYRSFIQQMEGQFDVTDYQIVPIKTFNEMLCIRDTIQSPILMFENLDQTMTEFVIPTNTKILYTFVIKVDNYDDIYAVPEEPEIVEETVILDETVPEEDIAEAMAAPDVPLEAIDYVEDDDVDCDDGIEVVGVVWPERAHRNKVYRYDPDGEQLVEGDMVLVPTRDAKKNRDVVRKATIAHGNHKIDPALHPYTLKKIIGVIRRHAEDILAPHKEESESQKNTDDN